MIRAVVFATALVALALAGACGGGNGNETAVEGTATAVAFAQTRATWKADLDAEFSKPTPDHTAQLATISARLATPATPTNTPPAPDASVRSCSAEDVSIELDGSQGLNAGARLTYFLLSNASETPCQLRRMPQVHFLEQVGDSYPMMVSNGTSQCPNPLFCLSEGAILLLPNLPAQEPGAPLEAGYARLSLVWHPNNAAGACPDRPPTPDRIVFKVPDDGGEIVQSTEIAPCDRKVIYFDYQPGHA